jgi:hypothetical protein
VGCNSAAFFGAVKMTSHKKNDERKARKAAKPKQKVPFVRYDKTGGLVFKNKVRISKGNFGLIVGILSFVTLFILDVNF